MEGTPLVCLYVRQPGSAARRFWDVNAAKHSGRQTDPHTSPPAEHISGCQIGPEEVTGGQRGRARAARQLVNAVDNQMDEPIHLGAAVLPSRFFFFFINPHYHCTWTCPKMLILVGHLPRAHVKFSIFPRTPDLQAKHLGSPVSQSEPRIYMCCLSGSAGSSWHIHLSPLCVLEQNLIPESTLTWLFLGQQLHYGAPAW